MNGINNGFEFVLTINNKKVKELNPLFRSVIDDIYYDINDDDIIKVLQNNRKEKIDIY